MVDIHIDPLLRPEAHFGQQIEETDEEDLSTEEHKEETYPRLSRKNGHSFREGCVAAPAG